MGHAYNTIAFRSVRCNGCGECMAACARAKTSQDDKTRALLSVLKAPRGGYELALCRQCCDPKCVMGCPAGALRKDRQTGIVEWAAEKCVTCLICTLECAYGGIAFDTAAGRVAKCDLCDGEPACVAACTRGALAYSRAGDIYSRWGEREDLFVPGLAGCQGCNSELLIRHTLRRVGPNTVLATPPGCIPGMGTVGYNGRTGTKVPVFHPLLTNTASMLSGIKRYYDRIGRDDVTVLALAGDGGTVDVGFQSLSGAAERNEKILYVCVDNEGYMNTGMQASGSTSYGSWTSTTPVGDLLRGKRGESKPMPLVMLMHGIEYVATASLAFMEDYYEKLDKAIAACRRGFVYLHVYSPCPSGWRFPSAATIEVCRKSVETNFAPLWEFEPGHGLRFTHPVNDPLPVADYVRLIGKYRHLDDAQIAHIQKMVDERMAFLRRFAGQGRTAIA